MEEKDVDVKLANGVLTIRGEKRDEKEEKNKNYYVRERSFGLLRALVSSTDAAIERGPIVPTRER
jgi:HSP20 family molecular chaperone IbpA